VTDSLFKFSSRPEYRAARDALVTLGYEGANIRQDREIATPTNPRWAVDGVAFFDRLAQVEHASVTIFDLSASGVTQDEAANGLRLTTAPFHLLFNQQRRRFVLWAMGPSETIPLRDDVSPGDLSRSLEEFAYDLSPRTVQRVKQGVDTFRHPLLSKLSPIQLTLWAEQANGALITRHFGHVLHALQTAGIKSLPVQSKIAAQLLAARILIDTDAMEDCRTVGEIPDVAEAKRFREYFDRALLARHRNTAQGAYEVLRNISLATFQPEMLRHLYKSLYSEEQAKTRGRFDTPLWLTRRIWQNIPVEFLRPEDRVCADLTCGWGSFLISGVERLSRLSDMANLRLSSQVFGNDNDDTTKELARVALLTSTGRDDWQVFSEDALRWQLPQGKKVSFIVGNPPFSGDRKTQRAPATGGRRYERANEFLDRALELLAPGGFLAMVMPGSFVGSEAGPQTRKRLLESCDVFEIWDLPCGIFDKATVQPMVIFAQKIKGKSAPSPQPVRIRNLQKQRALIGRFKESGLFTRSALAASQEEWTAGYRESKDAKTTHVLSYFTILTASEWAAIRSRCVPLADVSRIVPGCIKGSLGRCRTKVDRPKIVTWLPGPLRVLPSEFVIEYRKASQVRYPNEVEEPRYEDRDLFEGPKVLLVSDPNPSWGKRVKVAIDRRGAFASESFFVIGPRQEPPLVSPEVIAAVVRWKVCNGWALERLRYPKINKWVVESMPFPRSLLSSARESGRLAGAVHSLEREAQRGNAHKEAEGEIDDILMRAYGLAGGSVRERLSAAYDWDSVAPDRTSLDGREFANGADWIAQGTVVEVLGREEEVTLWLNCFDKPQSVRISPSMPGWLLRPETKFIAKVPASEVRSGRLTGRSWGGFEPEEFTYLSLAEGAQAINASIAKNRESGR
jgi:hypothetical protein